MKVIVVRDGSAILFSEFGQQSVNFGDVVLLCTNTLCGSEPEGYITTTTVYMHTDYLIDQVSWQHVGSLCDRLDARSFAEMMYLEPAQVLRLGEERAEMLEPWLDELVRLSLNEDYTVRFNRVQSLWFALADVMAPFVKVSSVRLSHSQRSRVRPTSPRHRQFCPLREAVRKIAEVLRATPETRWTLGALSYRVHMSPSQLVRVFTKAYGKTPLAFLTMVRAEELARLLRETDLPIETAMRRVGDHDDAGVMLVSATENIDGTPSGMLLHGIMSASATSVPTPKRPSKAPALSTIQKMLTNPYYKGQVSFRGAARI